MIRERVIATLRELAVALGSMAVGTEWHLFGSIDRDEWEAADIDLMIFCTDDDQADTLRRAIDPDVHFPPIHLALLTFDEAAEINAIHAQHSSVVFP